MANKSQNGKAKAAAPATTASAKQFNAEMARLNEAAKKAQTTSDKAFQRVQDLKEEMLELKVKLDTASIEYQQARQSLSIANKAINEYQTSYIRTTERLSNI